MGALPHMEPALLLGGIKFKLISRAKMTKKKTEITIIRSKWRTGGDEGEKNATGKGLTCLVNKQGYSCCLGFVAKQFRPSNKKLLGKGLPEECDFLIPELNYAHKDDEKCLLDTELTNDAVAINDNENTTRRQKETALKNLFKDSCYKLKFVD